MVPPRFTVSFRKTVSTDTDTADEKRVDTLPVITGGFPGRSYWTNNAFRRRLVACIHGVIPPALHQPAALFRVRYLTKSRFPLLFRSHSLFIYDKLLAVYRALLRLSSGLCALLTANFGNPEGNGDFMWRKVHEMFFALHSHGLYNDGVILDGIPKSRDNVASDWRK